ncbi:ATP-binding cassette domain-containing protein [Endozoicomonas numazuensis]|uniref:Uncharacterized protein n=1 Tax=Endozoicomonas numazuensis TaxID=1137799 RepID=A0A081NM80_9GAMM|nr:ABC transporter ATP-binding protein [Endozoicomonas numazuensis]KEQ19553.1 hypothetical protein GZ78_06490 [Endozoicomonas numazuensis]
MITNNKYTIISLSLITTQQVSIAASTWLIAKAGISVAELNFYAATRFVVYFFLCALSGYLISSIAQIFTTLSINHSIKNYYQFVFNRLDSQQKYNTRDNKDKTFAWLSGESNQTLEEFIKCHLELYSTYLGVILTLIVFWLTLGPTYSIACALGLMLSFLSLLLFKESFKKSGKEIQNSKLNINSCLDVLWNNHYCAPENQKNNESKKHFKRLQHFFDLNAKYTSLEQLATSAPITLSIIIIVSTIILTGEQEASFYGALVAVLPRSLQFFAYVHDLNIMSSRAILLRSKHQELIHFQNKLTPFEVDFTSTPYNLVIEDLERRQTIQPDDFMERVIQKKINKGRYRITGKNGSGKTSYLKQIKTLLPNAWLYQSSIDFLGKKTRSNSTGEVQLKNLEYILDRNDDFLLLDEWDANLDHSNTQKIDSLIKKHIQTSLVVEVLHKLQ